MIPYGNPSALGGGYGFFVPDTAIMPIADPLWSQTPDEMRLVLYRLAEREVLAAKRASLLLGEDARGGVLLPIHPLTRFARRVDIDYTKPPRGRRPYSPMGKASPNNAPLVATGARSRAVTLLRTATVMGGIWGYWDRDAHTGKYWGEVLHQHRKGFQQVFYGPSRSGKTKAAAGKYNPKTGAGLTALARTTRRVANIPARDAVDLPSQWVARVKAKVDAQWRSKIKPEVQKMQRFDGGITPFRGPNQRPAPVVPGVSPLAARGVEQRTGFAARIARAVARGIARMFGGEGMLAWRGID